MERWNQKGKELKQEVEEEDKRLQEEKMKLAEEKMKQQEEKLRLQEERKKSQLSADPSSSSPSSTSSVTVCFLCKRQFNSAEALKKHETLSALHKVLSSAVFVFFPFLGIVA